MQRPPGLPLCAASVPQSQPSFPSFTPLPQIECRADARLLRRACRLRPARSGRSPSSRRRPSCCRRRTLAAVTTPSPQAGTHVTPGHAALVAGLDGLAVGRAAVAARRVACRRRARSPRACRRRRRGHACRRSACPVQVQPSSSWQSGVQPSPGVLLPSSHCSLGSSDAVAALGRIDGGRIDRGAARRRRTCRRCPAAGPPLPAVPVWPPGAWSSRRRSRRRGKQTAATRRETGTPAEHGGSPRWVKDEGDPIFLLPFIPGQVRKRSPRYNAVAVSSETTYLVLDIETIPDRELFTPPEPAAGVERPFPAALRLPAGRHRRDVAGRDARREANRHLRRGQGRGRDDGRLRRLHGEVAAPGGDLERPRLRPAGAGAARPPVRPRLPLVLPGRGLPLPLQRGGPPRSVRRHLRSRRRQDDVARRRGAHHRAARARTASTAARSRGCTTPASSMRCAATACPTWRRRRSCSCAIGWCPAISIATAYRHAASGMLAALETDGRFGRLLERRRPAPAACSSES